VRWHAVQDFYLSEPGDRHYLIDALTGEIRFGDGQAGMIPPQGQNNIRITYHTGGGEAGNRAAETIVQLKSGIPYIDGVTNYEPAQGGAPREPIERLKARGSRVLRHRDRAVTAEDLSDLAYAASADVARAVTVSPTFDPTNLWLDPQLPAVPTDQHDEVDAGRIGLIIVPNLDTARPTPSLGLLRQVQMYLQQRCPATAELWVAGPEWVRVTVTTTVVPVSIEIADAVTAGIRTALERFLHPLTGGTQGQGWAFGRKPHRSDLIAIVEAVDGVDHVRSLQVALEPESPELSDRLKVALSQSLAQASQQPLAADLRSWLARALVYSGSHQISLVLEPA
jgi:predicted phage baseplate assembly protein